MSYEFCTKFAKSSASEKCGRRERVRTRTRRSTVLSLDGEARSYCGFQRDCDAQRISVANGLAEREGFEPPIRLPVCRISSAVHSTTLPPLQAIDVTSDSELAEAAENPICYRIATEYLLGHASVALRGVRRQRGRR